MLKFCSTTSGAAPQKSSVAASEVCAAYDARSLMNFGRWSAVANFILEVALLTAISGLSYLGRFHVALLPTSFAGNHYASADVRLHDQRTHVRMFVCVARGAKNLDIGSNHSERAIDTSRYLVVAVQVLCTSATLAFADFFSGFARQFILGMRTLGVAALPMGMICSRWTRKRARAFQRAKLQLIASMFSPLKNNPALDARRFLHSATAAMFGDLHACARAGSGFAAEMGFGPRVIGAADTASKGYRHG